MRTVFVQIRCRPGTTYQVADAIALRERYAELHSTSGDWDLLLKLYAPDDADIGHYINDSFKGIDDIERTHTIMTFKAF
ncbi:MAG: Lrp/AsnC ligand binding domain-containing protein [Pseudomonadota bacterium]